MKALVTITLNTCESTHPCHASYQLSFIIVESFPTSYGAQSSATYCGRAIMPTHVSREARDVN